MEANFKGANRAFCVIGDRDSNPRLGVPGFAKATDSLGVSQRSRGRGIRGAHTALIITLLIFRLNVDSIIGYTIPVSTKQESQYTEWKESWKDDYLK